MDTGGLRTAGQLANLSKGARYMASVIKRGKAYSVVYKVDGKQKWEACKSEDEANARKLEIE